MRLQLPTVALFGLAVASLTVGCSAPDGDGATRSKRESTSLPTATATLEPSLAGRIETDQWAYMPGDEVKVRWPGEELRGIAYSLDAWTGTDWKTQFYMSAVTRGHRPGGGPVWWATDETDHGWVDIGVGGPGPDIAVVPDIADPGTYRLCTANSPKKSCVLITVEEAL
jgi:hypothetical protein